MSESNNRDATPQYYEPPAPQLANQPQYAPHDGGTVAPRNEGGYQGNHPVAAFFHVIFKFLSILIYLLGTTFGMSTMAHFMCVVLLLAFDFWAVKNVTGRLMVKLRWWNRVREDGETEWIFESHPNAADASSFDAYFFWVTTYGVVGLWVLFLVFTITSPTGIPLALVGIALSAANAVGYTKCRKDAKQKLTGAIIGAAAHNPGIALQAMRAAA